MFPFAGATHVYPAPRAHFHHAAAHVKVLPVTPFRLAVAGMKPAALFGDAPVVLNPGYARCVLN